MLANSNPDTDLASSALSGRAAPCAAPVVQSIITVIWLFYSLCYCFQCHVSNKCDYLILFGFPHILVSNLCFPLLARPREFSLFDSCRQAFVLQGEPLRDTYSLVSAVSRAVRSQVHFQLAPAIHVGMVRVWLLMILECESESSETKRVQQKQKTSWVIGVR